MKRTIISELVNLKGSQVTLQGFVKTVRDQKRMQFLLLGDHTGEIQAIHAKGGDDDVLKGMISKVTPQSAVTLEGLVIDNPQSRTFGIEIQLTSINIDGLAETPLPIDANSDPDKQLDWRLLGLRRPENLLIFQVQTTLEEGMRDYWRSNGFIEIHSPKLMGSASESGSELFQLEYFGKRASLAQSPQFYKQMAMASGFDRVFEIGPVFRANPSFTSRHDTEFTSVDMEISWVESHEDVMAIEEAWLAQAIKAVKDAHGDRIKKHFDIDVTVPTLPFPRITLSEARRILAERGHVISEKDDLDPQGERMVAEYVAETQGHEFVFVTDYPIEVRPFYHMRHADAPHLTKSFDLLWKGLEITSGAQREHRPDVLMRQIVEKGIEPDQLKHYVDFFRYGCPPHGGMGVGLTRLLMIMLGRKNVREVTYLYRGPNRLTP